MEMSTSVEAHPTLLAAAAIPPVVPAKRCKIFLCFGWCVQFVDVLCAFPFRLLFAGRLFILLLLRLFAHPSQSALSLGAPQLLQQ